MKKIKYDQYVAAYLDNKGYDFVIDLTFTTITIKKDPEGNKLSDNDLYEIGFSIGRITEQNLHN